MWASLVEANEHLTPGADYFVKRDIDALLSRDPQIDTIILGCTHYPLLLDRVKSFVPEGITVLTQGEAVAQSLRDYLQRHPEIEAMCTKGGATDLLQPSRCRSSASRRRASLISRCKQERQYWVD